MTKAIECNVPCRVPGYHACLVNKDTMSYVFMSHDPDPDELFEGDRMSEDSLNKAVVTFKQTVSDLKKYGLGCKDCGVPSGLHSDQVAIHRHRVAIERATMIAYTDPTPDSWRLGYTSPEQPTRQPCNEASCPFQCAGCGK